MNPTNPSVDGFLRKSKLWQAELHALRQILLDCPLVEEVKWRVPVYTHEGRNVAFLGRFKESAVLSFVKGVLLKDAKKILTLPGENTQSARIVRITDVAQIEKLKPTLNAYLLEAIELEKSGAKVAFKPVSAFKVPEEFQSQLDRNAKLKKSFESLTPGRQRAYLLHFAGAKQSKTRDARVSKWMPQILAGKGIDDE